MHGARRRLLRALALRCPRCGAGGVFEAWTRLAERCPRCAHRFEREEGYWTGAWATNLVATEAILAAVLVGAFVATVPDVPVTPLVVVGVAVSVLAPLLLFPLSRTLWIALDLTFRPLEPDEEADAAVVALERGVVDLTHGGTAGEEG